MESRFRKKQTSIVLDYEELDDTENFFPKNLNSLELNFSSGATKNIFESIKKTLSSDYSKLLPKAFLVENKKASKQDYFKKEINLKFINHLNETKLKKKCDISPRDSNNISSIPTINIIPTVEKMAKTELNYDKNMLFINEESQSPRKKKNEKKCSPDPRSISWIYHEFSNIIFNRNESNETFLSHLLLTYKGLVQSKEYFNKQEKTNQLQQKIVKLFSKNSSKSKTLFFDLDNTLISRSYNGNASNESILMFNEKEEPMQIFLNIRPYCLSALSELAKYYEIYVFTSATKEYATKIMKLLDPEKKILKGALSRKHCYRTKNGIYIKDLGIVSNKNIKEMLIIDNLSYSFSFQIDNGIPILSWYDDPNDCELKHLTKYLIKIANLEDLRKPNRQVFKLSELSQKKINEIIYL